MGRIRTAAVGGLVEDNPLAAAAVTLTSNGLSALPLFVAGDFALVMFDPNGRSGEPFAKRITAHGSNAVTATMDAAAIYGVAREIKQGVPWRLTDILDQDGNGSGIIGLKEYNPGSLTTVTTTSTTDADVDATNLLVSFVVPPSGKVLVELNAMARIQTAAQYYKWSLREAAATIAEQAVNMEFTSEVRANARFLVTGLTPNDAKTYKWGHKLGTTGPTGAVKYGGGATGAGSALMTVRAVNV